MKLLLIKKIINILLIALFIVQPIVFLFGTHIAYATVQTQEVGENLTVNRRNEVSNRTLVNKEFIYDKKGFSGFGGFQIAKIAIAVFTDSIVNWINRGFDGNPAFVDNFGGFLREIADRETSLFIEGSPLELLCSPWKANIKIALSLPTGGYRQEVACTLSDIVANMDDFIHGDFSQGGWGGWFQLTTQSNNNPYSLYISSVSELDSRIATQQGIQTTQLNWGKGFLSKQECEELPEGVVGPVRCKTVTPGTVIEDQLSNVIGSGFRQLELADEFDEVVNALLAQLVNQVITGAHGLRGAPDSLRGVVGQTSGSGADSAESLRVTKEYAVSGIKNDINNETKYKDIKQNTLNSVLASETLLLNLISCYTGKFNGNLTQTNKDIAQSRINTAVSVIATQITPIKTVLGDNVDVSEQAIAYLDNTKNSIENASVGEVVAELASVLNLKKLNGEIGASDSFSAQQEQSIITAQMSALNATTNSQITECQNFPPPLFNNNNNNNN